MMIFSTVNSLKSVVWVILFLFGLFYMFGVAFTSAVVSYLDTLEMRKQSESATLQLHFGTLDVSILTLYMAMSGGQNWHVYYDSLATMKGGEFWCLLYILYITFAMFAVETYRQVSIVSCKLLVCLELLPIMSQVKKTLTRPSGQHRHWRVRGHSSPVEQE